LKTSEETHIREQAVNKSARSSKTYYFDKRKRVRIQAHFFFTPEQYLAQTLRHGGICQSRQRNVSAWADWQVVPGSHAYEMGGKDFNVSGANEYAMSMEIFLRFLTSQGISLQGLDEIIESNSMSGLDVVALGYSMQKMYIQREE
jgi:hypothetical protein